MAERKDPEVVSEKIVDKEIAPPPTTPEEGVVLTKIEKIERLSDTIYPCPHCGFPLDPHHDTPGSLHCYGPQCSGCCFWPPDASGKPQDKPGMKYCALRKMY